MDKNLPFNTHLTCLGLGTSKIASLGSKLKQKEFDELINISLESNVRVIDTANTYGSGDSERMIGKAIEKKRDEFFIITKAGFPYMNLPGFLSPLNQIGKKIIQKTSPGKNFSKDYLKKALNDSLRRLKTDSVDSFMLHEPVFSEIAFEECWRALEDIKKSGKAKFTGVSTSDLKVLETAAPTGTIDFIQTSVTFQPGFSNRILDFSIQKKIPVIANQILGSLNQLKTNDNFLNILKKYNKTDKEIVGILISYLVNKLNVSCVLIGTKNKKHLSENAEGLNQHEHLANLFSEIERWAYDN